MKKIDKIIIDELIIKAQDSPRQRTHFNVHEELSDPVQRLCIAFEPGSYIRPHIHEDKWEIFILLQGASAALVFDENGTVVERVELSTDNGARLIEFPPQCYHTIIIKEPGTIMTEIKPGPYKKPPEEDFASWAPQEGAEGTEEFELWMRSAEVGSNFLSQ